MNQTNHNERYSVPVDEAFLYPIHPGHVYITYIGLHFSQKCEQKALYEPHKKRYFIFLNRTSELALTSTQARGEGLSVRLGNRELCALRGG